MSSAKKRLRKKIETINEFQAMEALDFIEYVEQKRIKEFEESLKNAPEDDEPLSDEELESIKEAEEDIKAGRTYNVDEIWKRLGL